MENKQQSDDAVADRRLAERLKQLRVERGWSLDQLAKNSEVSLATLSRLENAEVSPTANLLDRLCSAFGMTMSRLMRMVEDDFAALVVRSAQPLWTDPESGFRRRLVSRANARWRGDRMRTGARHPHHLRRSFQAHGARYVPFIE